MIKLSILILSWNTRELLKKCLESIINGLTDSKINELTEIIVVDNGSTDGSVEMLKKLLTPNHQPLITNYQSLVTIRLIENKENLGFAKGNNQGIKASNGKYIMLLNSDTLVKEGAIAGLLKFLEGNSKIDAVSPLILNEDGTIQKDPCFLRYPSVLTTIIYYNPLLKTIANKFFPSILFSVNKFKDPTETDQLPGAAIIVKKSILDQLNGFDERFKLYFEDVDLSYRMKEKGCKLVIYPESKIVHFGRKSIKPVIKEKGIKEFYYLNFSALFLFLNKNYSKAKGLAIKIIVIFHLLTRLRIKLILRLIS